MLTTRTPGQVAYEADLGRWPAYHNGAFRPPWEALEPGARADWEWLARADANERSTLKRLHEFIFARPAGRT